MAAELDAMRKGALPPGWESGLPSFDPDPKGVASRESAGKVLNALAGNVPWLVGGSADLSPSTKTELKNFGSFQADNPGGRTMHFGVREHAMGAIANGMALSYIKPFAATFLVFADYMRAPVRLAAIMELPVTFVFTHDSIGVGEDGPTHQPIEHLATLRATPGLDTIRPGDANGAAEAWKLAVRQTRRPSALILSRQALPTLDRSRYAAAAGVARGAYILASADDPELILIGTGSELSLVVGAYEKLAAEGVRARVVSMPSWSRFEEQDDAYKQLVLTPGIEARLAVEQGGAIGWDRYVGARGRTITMSTFGASVPAIRQLIEDGININVTLLFGQQSYAAVAMAFVEGLEARLAQGQPIDRIASVASFFVSRIDAAIDRKIAERLKSADAEAEALTGLRGQVAIANAKLAYQWYLGFVASERWQALAERGAMPQRLLWASTGTKDPSYPDTLYVDNLIGPETVNTLPPKTMDAFRDHGTLAPSLTAEVESARRILREVDRLGLDLPAVADELVRDGVKQFADAADALLGAVAAKRSAIVGDGLNSMHEALPRELDEAVEARLERMRQESWSRRLWAGDATLWTGGEEAKWLGWLAAGKGEQIDPEALKALGAQAAQYRSAVLLGMGGSSLGPEVLAEIVGPRSGSPMIHVLDTTDPKQIAAVAAAIDPEHTLFIVASKSGSTMEPELLRAYFWNLAGQDGSRFIAITDPGSRLAKIAHDHGYAGVFLGDPTIGGRYSVLSVFGMVPAAVMGMDVAEFFARVAPMVQSCAPDAPPAVNPGVRLGAILGEAANRGRDKVTVLTSPALRAFGAWLEQLLAESTGKQGRGIVPVDLEPPVPPAHYGSDRLFVLLSLSGDDHARLDAHADALVTAGQPVVRIALSSKEMIGQEFFRWEIATAVAGAVIGIDPFDQPDVEDAKIRTRVLIDAYEATGSLAPETPFFEDGRVAFFGPADRGHSGDNAVQILRTHLARPGPGDYVGFLLYVERNPANEALVARMRERVVKARHVATVAGFGPRFLHSTGQAYKGGPRSGVFLEITRTPDPDVPILGRKASFGTVQLAQARGDLDVLASRGQRVLRAHLQSASLSDLEELLDEALRN